MASKNIEVKVGLLVIVGAAILIVALYLAKGYQYGREFYSVNVLFPEVGALAPGDPVAVSGVNKGKVKGIELFEGRVLAQLDMGTDVELKEDATFIVKNIGLMGERFVAVKTGKSETPLDLTQPASGGFDPGIPEVMGMMGDVIGNMGDLINLLEETVISPATLDKFSETVTNLNKITGRLESATKTNIPKIDSAINDFTIMAKRLKNGLAQNQEHIDTAVVNFDEASRRLIALTDDMAEASARLKSFATDLDESEGSLRMFLEDRRLYDDLRLTAHNLDSLVTDIRDNPKKYINFTVEIF
ncbi:MAG: MCE family protein [FCB group bacterium]|nr:MCE family protein [FCB group bacterium]